jgi:hypothetical protein
VPAATAAAAAAASDGEGSGGSWSRKAAKKTGRCVAVAGKLSVRGVPFSC